MSTLNNPFSVKNEEPFEEEEVEQTSPPSHLRIAEALEDALLEVEPVDAGALDFEGRKVDGVLTKVAGLTSLEVDGLVLHADDRVRMVVEGRVTGVTHAINRDGDLIRTHTIKVIRSDLAPWDPSDPRDNGVVRA